MPALAISDNMTPEILKKDKKKKIKEAMEIDSPIDNKSLKKEKKKKSKKSSSDSEEFVFEESEEKSKKKRKVIEEDEEKSDTSSERGEAVNLKKKKAKKMKLESEVEEEVKEENPNAVSNFRISEPLREKLREKGIEALFPIQAMTFDIILDGSDLVGRARTGQVIINLFDIFVYVII